MNYIDYTALDVTGAGGVLTVTLNHPPLNLLDRVLVPELKRLVREVADDASTRVVVFDSAVPDFFAAHVDAGYMADPAGFMALGEQDTGYEELLPLQHLIASIRALPQVTIAKLTGFLRGGGNELAMAADLRYAADGVTWVGQIEARMGIIPGGGGTQLLARAVGRSRALEAVLTADVYDTRIAELYRTDREWLHRRWPVRFRGVVRQGRGMIRVRDRWPAVPGHGPDLCLARATRSVRGGEGGGSTHPPPRGRGAAPPDSRADAVVE